MWRRHGAPRTRGLVVVVAVVTRRTVTRLEVDIGSVSRALARVVCG